MVGGQKYQLDPAKPADFQQLLRELSQENLSPPLGLVHLWGIAPEQEIDTATLQERQLQGCGTVLYLVQAIAQAGWVQWPSLWLVTRGTQSVTKTETSLEVSQSSLWGLGRVMALEHPELHCVRVDLEPSGEEAEVSGLLSELLAPDGEDQIAYRQGIRYVPRLVQRPSPRSQFPEQGQVPTTPFKVKLSDYGTLENLSLAPMQRRPLQPDEVEIEVRAAGLNFRDVLNALGMLKEDNEQLGLLQAEEIPFGGECAGTVVAVGEKVTKVKIGDEVIAAPALGSLSTFVNVKADWTVPKPPALNWEEAATIATTFLTAYYGLYILAKIQPGDRVLIHAAAGGVGQAAVQLAQMVGAEVFATAHPSKWEFLRSLGVEQIMNSRTLDFAEEVMARTGGKGVDVILNSLTGDYIAKSLETLAPGGRLVEIGKIGIWDEQQIRAVRPDVSYFSFDLLALARQEPELIGRLFTELRERFGREELKPLPHKVFPVEEVVAAFRYMAQAKLIGKVVISMLPASKVSDLATGAGIRADGSYLITGGLGALGLQVAQWMVERGARALVLAGRHEASRAAQKTIEKLEEAGAKVLVIQADVAQARDVALLLEKVKNSLPPLKGIIHAAGILDDGSLLQLSWERFEGVMAPKVAGAWNLHQLTQDLPLDFFACFSSVASLLGSPGQGNYAAANAFLDGLAHYRRALGLPGLSINWGPWARTVMAAALEHREPSKLAARSLELIPPEEGLNILETLLSQEINQVGVFVPHWSNLWQQFPQGLKQPFLEEFQPGAAQKKEEGPAFLLQLQAAPVEQRRSRLTEYLRGELARVLGIGPSEVNLQKGFFDLGMDSLMAIELKNRLQNGLGCSIPSTLAFDYPTGEALADYLMEEALNLEFERPKPSGEREETLLEELPTGEIAALLAKELQAIEEEKGL
jgi:myxalamid-type polyketide synthase MxaB